MLKGIILRDANIGEDFQLYLSCFSNNYWSSLFDLNLQNQDLDWQMYVQQKISGQYKGLYRYIVCSNNEKYGFSQIFIEDEVTGRGTLTGGILPEFLSKGYGSAGLFMSLKIAFYEINLNKVICNVYDFNTPSFSLLEKAGFKLEGILRQHSMNYATKSLVDIRIYSMLKKEFHQSRLAITMRKIFG
ncbi:GNAT family N-acetyltransferase [Nostoc sp. C052]|uniref:GNAT family N-acetyltransferase n=1 Tax=Nostoc sp. C052 TaxID=2576902 RepID=UPI0015C2C986|nr:GNAT family protein [Nostoc sp. C052]QLE39989.1 GNAT family N-acetyltransferase [Nostoc sp. C052]